MYNETRLSTLPRRCKEIYDTEIMFDVFLVSLILVAMLIIRPVLYTCDIMMIPVTVEGYNAPVTQVSYILIRYK